MADNFSPVKTREQQLLFDLDSEKRTVCISAIVQLARIGSDPMVIRKLHHLGQSSIREIALLASQAISRIQIRIGDQKKTQFTGDNISREHFLTPLPDEIPQLLDLIRLKPEKIPEEYLPAAAEFLEKHGSESDVEFLVKWIGTGNSVLCLPYIDALGVLSPRSLNPLLHSLLASEAPLVRVRAISVLKRIDDEEAFAHLAELLGSRNPEERLAGLSVAFLFSFENLRPMLLTILKTEDDEDVLKAVETLFENNPESESALRLLDILEVSSKAGGIRITAIFKKVCNALRVAEIIPSEEATPEAILARWKKERLQKFLDDLEMQITVSDWERLESIERWLLKNKQNPDVARFIENLALNAATEDLYRRLTSEGEKETSVVINWEDPASLSVHSRRKMLESIDAQTFERVSGWIRDEAVSGVPIIRAGALNALRKFSRDPDDFRFGEDALKSNIPKLVLIGIRFFKPQDPRIQTCLPTLLQSADPYVRVAGIRLALQVDVGKAIETVSTMLRSGEPVIRAHAANCLMVCPIEKMELDFAEILRNEIYPEIAQKILLVLLSNPSHKILETLDRIKNTKEITTFLLVSQARSELFDRLLHLGSDPGEEIRSPEGREVSESPQAVQPKKLENETRSDPTFGKEAIPEKVEKAFVPKIPVAAFRPYSVSEVRNTIRKRELANKKVQATVKDDEEVKKTILKFIFALGAAILFFAFIFRGHRVEIVEDIQSPVETTAKPEILEGFRLFGMCRLKGKIDSITNDGLVKFLPTEKIPQCREIWYKPMGPGAVASSGDLIEIQLLPYRKLEEGVYLAEGHEITK